MRHYRPISALLAAVVLGLSPVTRAAQDKAPEKAVDEPVTIVTFEMKDGKKYQAMRFSSMNSGEFKTYVLTTLDGKKAMLLETDLASRTEERVALAGLKEDLRKDVLRMRAAAAAARAESEARAADEKLIGDAKRMETAARAALNKARENMAAAETLLASAEAVVKNAPIEMAKAEARYDASKTELSTPAVPAYLGGSSGGTRRADYLRDQMKQAAEDKARIEAGRKDAAEVVQRTHENLRAFEARADAAKKSLAAAEAETRKVIEKLKASRDRAEADFTIRKNPEALVETK